MAANEVLLEELRNAHRTKVEAHRRWSDARMDLQDAKVTEREARQYYERCRDAVDEIARELATGESSLPLMGAAKGNGTHA